MTINIAYFIIYFLNSNNCLATIKLFRLLRLDLHKDFDYNYYLLNLNNYLAAISGLHYRIDSLGFGLAENLELLE